MNVPLGDRRTFLGRAVAAAGTAAVAGRALTRRANAAPAPAPGQSHPVRLGGPVFNAPGDPEGLALAHRKLGYRAAYCPGVGLNDTEQIRELAAAFAKHDVVIAEVGRWVQSAGRRPGQAGGQPQDGDRGAGPGRGHRRPLLRRHRRLATIPSPGSARTRTTSRRKFFDAAVENARKIIDAVKPKRAKFCYEMMGWALPDSARLVPED